ncbi:Plug domain-containing protein, partial [Sphingobium sp. 3R8]|uniref:TonB-dependent receptor plug domain-containing protein n=1 Tax=Sphingobium sp. 3R8 TaxID=2874921 RepID=UPI001CCD5238
MTTISKSALLSGASMALVGLAIAAPAQGQQTPADPMQAQPTNSAAPAGQVGEIVVTAQRRSQRLQDVPIAITAISPQSATQLGLRNLRDIQLAMPGTDLAAATGFTMLFIRGIGVPFTTPGLEPPVAIYLDGAYLPRAGGLNSLLDMVDPGQIEVLRGP